MRCEEKLAKRQAVDRNAYAEQVQQLDALWSKIGKKRGCWVEMLTLNKFSNLMRCEAKLAKVEAINWNAYAVQVQQLDALWGKIGKKRLLIEMLTQNNCINLMRSKAKLAKVEVMNWIFTQNKFSNLMRCEAKLAKVEAIKWNAYLEQFQQFDALWGKNGEKTGCWLKCLRRTSSATWCVVRQNWEK